MRSFATLLIAASLTLAHGAALAQSSSTNEAANANPPAVSACPTVLQHTVLRLQDEKPQPLCQYAGQVVLVVNTASYCGFTPQYADLEKLYAQFKGRGLVVLGFPSNDFAQEPGANDKIADFCENTYGVKFPMFTKTSVRGDSASPLFKQLTQRSGTSPKWNFYKYLINRDGSQVLAFSSMTNPGDARLVQAVEQFLKQTPKGR